MRDERDEPEDGLHVHEGMFPAQELIFASAFGCGIAAPALQETLEEGERPMVGMSVAGQFRVPCPEDCEGVHFSEMQSYGMCVPWRIAASLHGQLEALRDVLITDKKMWREWGEIRRQHRVRAAEMLTMGLQAQADGTLWNRD